MPLALLLAVALRAGEAVELPAIPDVSGRLVSLSADPVPRATVIAFTSLNCPIASVYAPRLRELAEEYASQGIRFLAVDPGPAGAVPALIVSAKEWPCPLLVDSAQAWADRLGVSRSTEVILLDAERKVRYRGALDDQYSVGTRKPAPRRRYLVEAIDALLAGQPIPLAETNAPGCLVTRAPKAKAAAAPLTFHKDVAPIVRARCAECHRPGEIGPMPLLTYDDVSGVSAMIGEVVSAGRMPPWHADPRYGRWSNDRSLSASEKKTLLGWIDAGCPEGAMPAAAPPPLPEPGRWHIGTPDLVVKTPLQKVPAQGTVDYRYLRVPTGLTEDRWVRAAEVHAGARGAVHHILVFASYPKDRKKEEPPFDGGLDGGYFASLVPGERPNEWPEGSGKLLPAGGSLLFQIHYTTNGTAQDDVSEIGLVFSKEPPKKTVVTRGIHHLGLKIAPGDAAATFRSQWKVPADVTVLSLMPHMHFRGKSFRYEAAYPDGKTEVLLDVPRYDFNWQATYRPAEPLRLPRGTKVTCTAVYDNSPANPANPDPTATVKWGDQSWDEMLIGYVDYVRG